jgi:glutamine amidotransferase
MCIAIYKPAHKDIDRETLERCYDANPDGCGLAFIENGELSIYASMNFEDFYDLYLECLAEAPESPFLLHFRIATHGSVDEDNCHPFFIDDEHVFMHNGTITPMTQYCNRGRGKSDTVEFGERILENLPDGWFMNKAIKALIEHYIGWSKIVVMDADGNVDIFNEDKGVWDNGIWYSNTTYKPIIKTFISDSIWEQCDFCDKWSPKTQRFNTDGFTYNLCVSCRVDFDMAGIPMRGVI